MKPWTLLFGLLPFVACDLSAAAIFSENFDELAQSADSFGPFGLLTTGVNSVGGGRVVGPCTDPESGNCLGVAYFSTTLQSIDPIHLDPGDYALSFDFGVSGTPPAGISGQVKLGNLVNQSFSVGVAPPGAPPLAATVFVIPFSVAAAQDATLSLFSTGGGFMLVSGTYDNIRIDSVPEPATLGMFGLGMLGLWAVRRSRSRA